MPEILFIYNAKRGILNKSFDWLHKSFSPSTYSCELCALTHHNFGGKDRFKQWLLRQNLTYRFLYKEDWNSLDQKYSPPLIAYAHQNKILPLLDHQQIEKLTTLDELLNQLDNALEQLNSSLP